MDIGVDIEKEFGGTNEEFLNSLLNDIITDLSIEVCFDIHKKLKFGLLSPNGDSVYSEIIEKEECDIFGQSINSISQKHESFECENCGRQVVATRFAPHLEKCMGLGRNSSRLASKRIGSLTTNSSKNKEKDKENQKSDSDDEYTGNQPLVTKKRDSKLKNSDREHVFVVNAGNIDSVKSKNRIRTLLKTKCGVISHATGKMCTKTLNCPQHTQEQRRQVRLRYCGEEQFWPVQDPNGEETASSTIIYVDME